MVNLKEQTDLGRRSLVERNKKFGWIKEDEWVLTNSAHRRKAMGNQYNGASQKEERLVTLQDLRESSGWEASCRPEPACDGGHPQEKPAV